MRLAAIGLLAAVLLAGHALSSAPAQDAPQPQAAYTYQGTVHEVEVTDRTLTIITGVGFALRLIEIHVTPATTIVSGDTTLTLARLDRGAVVRAECQRRDGRLVADRIERVAGAGSRGGGAR